MTESVISGPLQDCVEHFYLVLDDHPKLSIENSSQQMQLVREFLHLKEGPSQWLLRGTSQGLNKLRLEVLLVYLGFDVHQFTQMRSIKQQYVELLGLSIVSSESLAKALGYKHHDSLLSVLRGNKEFPDRLKDRYNKVLRVYDFHILDARVKTQKMLKEVFADVFPVGSVALPDVILEQSVQPSKQNSKVIPLPTANGVSVDPTPEILARLLTSALPLVEYMFSDKCSREERTRLRTLMQHGNEDGLMKVSTMLNGLLSHEARKNIKAQLEKRGGRW